MESIRKQDIVCLCFIHVINNGSGTLLGAQISCTLLVERERTGDGRSFEDESSRTGKFKADSPYRRRASAGDGLNVLFRGK